MNASRPNPHPRRALVTGGAGFIGSHLCDLLLAAGFHVTVVDDLSTGRRRNLPDPLPPNLRFVHSDLAAALQGPLAKETFDQVYHLAAAVGVRLIVDEPVRSIETNIIQTAALLRYSVGCGPGGSPAATLVASSSEVYGKSDKPVFSEDDDVVYGPTTKSRWSYACSKAIDEHLALAHFASDRLPAVVVRLFNTVGPRQIGSYGMVLPNFVASALRAQPLVIYGDGEQSRCFCDVRDVVAAMPRLLETPACHGRVFNVGSDEPLSINALASRVISTLGSASVVRHIPYDQAYAPGFEDLRQRRPDLSRIRAAIGFAPRVPLAQTIRDIAAEAPAASGHAAGAATPVLRAVSAAAAGRKSP